MTKRLYALVGAVLLATAFAVAQAGRTIQADITYTGSGTVDASHKIYVALWDSANFDGGPPADTQSVESKTGTVIFKNVQTVPAYVTTAYDPTGKWDAQSSPPSGSSLGMYGSKPPTPEPITVEPGKTVKIKVTFGDSNKVP
jgi:uncharacterized cupredoxin-like copper-binding protein